MQLDGAELRRADLRDVEIAGGSWANAEAVESVLRRVRFRNTRLTGAVFANATLDDVVFEDCRLDLASFRFAKLARVRFERCRLDEADLYEARFESRGVLRLLAREREPRRSRRSSTRSCAAAT